jgi:hypothetical protein
MQVDELREEAQGTFRHLTLEGLMNRRAFLASSAVALSPVSAGAQTATLRSKILGVWSLVEASTIAGDAVSPWFGRTNPVTGLLIVQDSGWMSVQISGSRPGKIGRPEYLKLSDVEKSSWMKEYYGYYGKFSIDENMSVVTYEVIDSLLPYERGMILKRKCELMGDMLTLLTEPRQGDGVTSYNKLVWKKVG